MIQSRIQLFPNSKSRDRKSYFVSDNPHASYSQDSQYRKIINLHKQVGNQNLGGLLKSQNKIKRQVFIDEIENLDASTAVDSENVISPGESIPVIWFNQNTLIKRDDEHVSSRENFRVLIHTVKQHLDVVGLNADIKFRGYESTLETDAAPGLSQRRAEKVRDSIIRIFYNDLHLRNIFASRSEAIGMGTDDSIEGEEWNQRVDVEMQPAWGVADMGELELSDDFGSTSDLGNVSIDDCSEDKLQLLQRIYKSAYYRVRWALNKCNEEPTPQVVIDGLAEYFNANLKVLPDVISKLNTIYEGFSENYEFECEGNDFWYCPSKRNAYVRLVGNTIHLCPKFFDLNFLNQNETVIHEVGHISEGLYDELYYKESGWDSMYPAELLNNADSFSNFVMFITEE